MQIIELGSPPTTQPTSAIHGEMNYKRKKQNRRRKIFGWRSMRIKILNDTLKKELAG